MESELFRVKKQNTTPELNIEELRQKLKATEKELQQERQKVHDQEAVVKRFKTDLPNCVAYIQEPKMSKESIKALYEKHVHKDIADAASVDAEVQKEYACQRDHLEKSVASLQKKLAKDTEIHRADNVRIMQENMTLITAINDLRRELKLARNYIHDLESTLGVSKRKGEHPPATIATSRVALTIQEVEEEKKKIIAMQKMEIKRLRLQINELENGSRPNSSSKLPPM